MTLTLFLWVFIVLHGLDALSRLIFISIKKDAEYPRTQQWTRGEDTLRMLFAIAFAIWAFILLP